MKSLFLPMIIVGAVALWYSNAQAADFRHAHEQHGGGHSQHQPQHHAQQQYRHHESRGHEHHTGNSGRHEGAQHNEARGESRRGEHSEHGFNQSHQESHGQNGESRHASYNTGVNQRQQNQRERIEQASRSGQLTGAERKSLVAEQRSIAAEEKQFRSDGHLSRNERQDLQKDLTLASQHIYNESHDAERRGDGRRDDNANH